jgi:hypothetical protein
MKDVMGRSPPAKETDNFLTSSLSNKISNPLKFTQHSNEKEAMKNRTTLNSDKNEDYEHRTFNNVNNVPVANPINKSQGVKNGSAYYPNKTTSNKASSKHHIVALINQQDTAPHEYGKNKILLD